MSVALFRSILRTAIRDALAEDASSVSALPPRIESATSIEAHAVRRAARVELTVYDGLGALGRAP
jgi:hypothetical protein